MEEHILKSRFSLWRKTRFLNYAQCDSYPLMPCLLRDNDTCHNIVESWFLWLLEVRYAIWNLELKFMLKHDFCFSETDKTRHKRVNSLKACSSRANSPWASLGWLAHLSKMCWLVRWFCSAVMGSISKCLFKILVLLHSKDPYANIQSFREKKKQTNIVIN